MFPEREHVDIFDNDHLIVVFIEDRVIEDVLASNVCNQAKLIIKHC